MKRMLSPRPLQAIVSPRRLHLADSKDIFKLALGDQVRNNFFHTFSTQLINLDHVCGPEVLAIQTFTSTLILLRQCQKILVVKNVATHSPSFSKDTITSELQSEGSHSPGAHCSASIQT